jgi:NTE family protein
MTGKALVLGGGGITGIAWEWGMLAGLAEAGIDLASADLVVGTSAGSVVGAQVAAGADVEQRYAAQLEPATGEIAARLRRLSMLRWSLAALRHVRDPRAYRARIGRLALAAKTVPEAERRAVIQSRLPTHEWPERRLLITAVDAVSGEFVVYDKDAGVSLVDAVGASCAVPGVWPPVTVNGRRMIDGGVRSAANVDLADGCDRVVVIAPLTAGAGPIPSVAAQVAALRNARAVVLAPDRAARGAFGRNLLDPAARAPAARAGRAQAARAADAVRAAWA